jgi:hypothetical protein
MSEGGLHPDLVIAHLDRAGRYVVRPQVEGTAAFKVEAGVVPMAGQYPIIDAAALEGKTHVRATIVEGKDAPAGIDDEDRTMIAMENQPTLRLQFL